MITAITVTTTMTVISSVQYQTAAVEGIVRACYITIVSYIPGHV